MFSPQVYEEVADWYPAQFFESSFYELWKNLNKEVNFCHSRIGIENANQQYIADFNKNISGTSDPLGDYIIETEVGGKVQAIPGVGDFTKYTAAMDAIMDFYFKFANSSRFSDGNGAQKTSAEANSSNSAQVETLEAKLAHREYEYTMLIAKVLAALGVCEYEQESYPFVFKINGNLSRQENAYLDYIIKQVQSGLMSIVEAIAAIRKLSYSQAESIFDKIKEFNEENDVMTSTMMSEMDQQGFASDGFDQGGRPEDTGGQ